MVDPWQLCVRCDLNELENLEHKRFHSTKSVLRKLKDFKRKENRKEDLTNEGGICEMESENEEGEVIHRMREIEITLDELKNCSKLIGAFYLRKGNSFQFQKKISCYRGASTKIKESWDNSEWKLCATFYDIRANQSNHPSNRYDSKLNEEIDMREILETSGYIFYSSESSKKKTFLSHYGKKLVEKGMEINFQYLDCDSSIDAQSFSMSPLNPSIRTPPNFKVSVNFLEEEEEEQKEEEEGNHFPLFKFVVNQEGKTIYSSIQQSDFICPLCDNHEEFSGRISLVDHIKAVHDVFIVRNLPFFSSSSSHF